MSTWTHIGIYALVVAEGRLLAVRKTRGPYCGLLDAPGGSRETCDANDEATLRREVFEETGLEIAQIDRWHELDLHVRKNSSGDPIEFHHTGKWAHVHVRLEAPIQDLQAPASQDSDGIVWLPVEHWRSRGDLSALLRTILTAAENSGYQASMQASG